MIAEKLKGWPRGAIVRLARAGGEPYLRPAVVLWETAFGFGWIEPAYLRPDAPSSPALHEIEAALTDRGAWIDFTGPDWSGRIEQDDGYGPEGAPLSAWLEEVKRRGLTVERARAEALALAGR